MAAGYVDHGSGVTEPMVHGGGISIVVRKTQDHLQRMVTYHFPPERIISLCPSITETLYAIQNADRIVGRTRYCIHPGDKIKSAKVVGGTKQIKEEVIVQLKPDLIIAEKEENPQAMIDALTVQYPVYVVNVENYDDALKMITDLGIICGEQEMAMKIVEDIMAQFHHLQSAEGMTAAYMIWENPYMVAGSTTYINSILEYCGFQNAFTDRAERYPVITTEDLLEAKPDVVFLSSEPYPFREKHRYYLAQQLPMSKVILVEGEYFSWYGVRMTKAVPYLNELISALQVH